MDGGGGGGRVGRRDVEMRTTLVRADGRVVERPDGNRLLVDAYNVLRRDHDALRADHASLRDELDRAQATTPRTNGGDPAVDGAISAEEAAALKGRVARLVLDTDKGCDVVSTVRGAIGDVLGRFFKDALEQVAGTADAASVESLAANTPDTSYTSSAGGGGAGGAGDDDPLQHELRLLQQAKDTLIMVLTTAAAEHRRSAAQLRALHDADARRAAEAAEAAARAAVESEAHDAVLSELNAQLQQRSSAAAAAAAMTTTTTAATRRNSTSGLRSVSPLATAVAAAAAAAAAAFESHPNPPTQQQQTPVAPPPPPPPGTSSPRSSLHFSSASPSAGDAGAAAPPPPDEPRTLEKVRSGGPRVVGTRRALSANRRAHERFSTSGPHERLDNTTSSTTTSAALRGGDDVVTSPRRLRRYGRNDESGDADGGTEIPTIGVLLEVGGKVSASVSDAFHVGDIIMSGDGRTVITQQDFANIVAAANGGNVSCRVRRNGTNKTVEFRLKRGVATAAKKLPAKVKQPTKLKQKK